MGDAGDSTSNVLLSGIMGMLGGLVTVPFNAIFSWWLKRDEQRYQHKLNMIAKQRELLLQHQLEMERKGNLYEKVQLTATIASLQKAVARLEERLSHGD